MGLKLVLSFYGLILYHVFVFVSYKDRLDKRDISINIKDYVFKFWDNWVLSALAMPLMVYFTPDMLAIYNMVTSSSLEVSNVYYIFVGFVIEFLYGLYRSKARNDFFDKCDHDH